MSKRNITIAVLVVVLIGGWYAFRPERLFVDATVNEPLSAAIAATPGGDAALMSLAEGQFHTNAHETKGTATVLAVGGGMRILRLTNFATSNGPDVRVYLVAAPDVNDDATVKTAKFVELGVLKGNIGDQNYDIPESVDLSVYRTVTIWCKRFGVNFGSAPLKAS